MSGSIIVVQNPVTRVVRLTGPGVADVAAAIAARDAAITARDAAITAKNGAIAQVALAVDQVTAAQGFATASGNSATASANSATASANSATASANSATASGNSAAAALTSENNAATARDIAKAFAGAMTFTFSTTTVDADPGNGTLRLNNAAMQSATLAYIDNLDRDGNTVSAILDTLDDSTNIAQKATVIIREGATGKTALYALTGAVVDGTGYRKLTLTYLGGSTGAFTNAAVIGFSFCISGNKGADGVGTGDVVGPAASVDSEVVLFSGVTGKLVKRSTGTGLLQVTAGVASYVNGVLATVLAGLDTTTVATITASDTVLSAIGKTWAKLVGHMADAANPHSTTKAQVGLGSADNTADTAKVVASAAILTTARTINGVSFNGSANIEVIAAATTAATSKATPVDADMFTGTDSASSNVLVKFSWANIKAALLAYFTGIFTAPDRNKIDNSNFAVNQRAVSGSVVLAAGVYGHDRWKAGAAGCSYTFATAANVTTITISAGSLIQVIPGENLQSATHTLSWTGTSTGKIGAGAFSASGVTGAATGGTNLNIEFSTGTLAKVMFEQGSVQTTYTHRSVAREFAECVRYYRDVSPGANSFIAGYGSAGAYGPSYVVELIPPMRAAPTVSHVVGTLSNVTNVGNSNATASQITLIATITALGDCFFYVGTLKLTADL